MRDCQQGHGAVVISGANKSLQRLLFFCFFLDRFFFFFFGHVLFQFLCNLQQYCDSAYNKLNSLQQKEFINNKNELYLENKKGEREREKETNTHKGCCFVSAAVGYCCRGMGGR